MYERFTDRARKVMQLANQEAQRFSHEHVGTEHILVGLAKEGTGVAGQVLKNLNIDLRKIRLEVERLVSPGPDTVVMGKLPQTPRAKKVIEHSIEEARGLNHNYVGTEHLLLGLLCENEGIAATVLKNLGLELGAVREEVIGILNLKKSVCQVDVADIITAFMDASKTGPVAEAKVREFLELAAQRGWVQGRGEKQSFYTGTIVTLPHGVTFKSALESELEELRNRVSQLEKKVS